MPECKKCQTIFPDKMKIDGIWKCLHRRSYCLNCSPYKSKMGYGIRKKTTILKHEKGKGIKVCPICAKEFPYTKNNVCSGCRSLFARYKLKLRAISLLGEKCINCGCNDSDVLSFHHLDPNLKFDVLSSMWGSNNWEEIKKEALKCVLLCHNCHAKKHIDYKRRNDTIAYYGRVVELEIHKGLKIPRL